MVLEGCGSQLMQQVVAPLLNGEARQCLGGRDGRRGRGEWLGTAGVAAFTSAAHLMP